MIIVQPEPFDPGDLFRGFVDRAGEGAVASFLGTVRGSGGVECLTLQHYPGFTEQELGRLADETSAAFGLSAILLVHRHGPMAPGEPIMLAATAAPHRREALGALDYLVEALKTEAPFWKREQRDGSSVWLDPPSFSRKAPNE